MNIFLTGATGYIGSAVADKLSASGHQVFGLARSDQALQSLRNLGIQPVRGDLANTDVLVDAAKASDGVIHLAQTRMDLKGDWMTQMQDGMKVMGNAVDAIADALDGTGKPFVITGGTGSYGDVGERIVDEDTPMQVPPMMTRMAENEQRVLETNGFRGIVIRPAIVYGRGGGPVTMLIEQAQQSGKVLMAGSGDNLLSTVHVEDVATLYALAVENAPAGTLLNGVAEPFVSQKALLRAVSLVTGLSGAVERLPDEVARELAYGMGGLFAREMRVSGERARRLLGWQPHGVSILDELLQGKYAAGAV